jgi:hypothetical protein
LCLARDIWALALYNYFFNFSLFQSFFLLFFASFLLVSLSPPQSLLKYLQILNLHEVSWIKVDARGGRLKSEDWNRKKEEEEDWNPSLLARKIEIHHSLHGRLKSITPCALTFPSLETSCKPLRRREDADGVPGVSEF